MRRTTLTIAALALSSSLLTGCSGDDDGSAAPPAGESASDVSTPSDSSTTTVGPTQEFCDALDDLEQTRDDARDDPGAVEDSLDDVAAEAPDDTASQWEQAKADYQDYADALQRLIDDAPDVPGVDEEEFVRQNSAAVRRLAERYLGPADDLTDQLRSEGREQCDSVS